MSLTGKRVLVAGGSGPFGRALVPRLLDEGAWVAVTYRSNESLAKLFETLDPDGPQPKAVQCELSDADSVAALADELAQTQALPLHGLVAVAGGWEGGAPVWEAPSSQLHDMLYDNVLTAWNVVHRFTGGMVEAGHGRIVTFGAVHSARPMKGNAAYAAAKGAVAALTATVARDLRGTGVSAVCVQPLVMGEHAEAGAVTYEEAAALVAWLLDDDAAVVNGDLVPLLGGG